MKIEIRADGFDPGTELLQFARYCAGFELGTQRNRISSVAIHLSVAGEPRDAKDKRCVVQVDLHEGRSFVARIMDSDMHVAIFRALEQAGWTVAREPQHRQDRAGGLPIMERPLADQHEPDRAA